MHPLASKGKCDMCSLLKAILHNTGQETYVWSSGGMMTFKEKPKNLGVHCPPQISDKVNWN
jgi:hypothetical protein